MQQCFFSPGLRSFRRKSHGRMAFVSYLGEEKFWILTHLKEKDEWEAGREGREDGAPEALQFPLDQSTQDTLHSISTCFGISYLESLQNQKLYLITKLSYISQELNNNLSTWPLGCSISQWSLVWTIVGMFTLIWQLLVIGWNLVTVMIEAQCWNQAVPCPKLLHTVQNNGTPSWCVLGESILQVAFGSTYMMEDDCTPEWTY